MSLCMPSGKFVIILTPISVAERGGGAKALTTPRVNAGNNMCVRIRISSSASVVRPVPVSPYQLPTGAPAV